MVDDDDDDDEVREREREKVTKKEGVRVCIYQLLFWVRK